MEDTGNDYTTKTKEAPQSVEERLASVKAQTAQLRKADRQHEAGFDNEGDFDAWELLEKLRNATLELRRTTNRSSAPGLPGGF